MGKNYNCAKRISTCSQIIDRRPQNTIDGGITKNFGFEGRTTRKLSEQQYKIKSNIFTKCGG